MNFSITKGENETWLEAMLKKARRLQIEDEANKTFFSLIQNGFTEVEAAYYAIANQFISTPNYTINQYKNKEDNMSSLEQTNITLADALSATTETKNRALSNATTFSHCLNFFFTAPMASNEDAIELWRKASNEDLLVATKLALWLRDPRRGAGKRDSARAIFSHMEANDFCYVNVWEHIPTYGRYDDLLSLKDCINFDTIVQMWASHIRDGNQLAAKWMPRERSSNKTVARQICNILGMSYKEYRVWLASNTEVTETKMCASNWSDINYGHVPSQCHNKNKAAFKRNDEDRYNEYLEQVEAGTKTINTSTLWPHQVIGSLINDNFCCWNDSPITEEDKTTRALWNNLPNWVDDYPTVVVCDTSASMFGFGRTSNKVTPGVIAISLALYTAERLKGPYQNKFMSFSNVAKWIEIDINLSIAKRIKSIPSIVENTNLQSVFDLILNTAKRFSIPQELMPKRIIIISDMQFDEASTPSETNFEEIKNKYNLSGYNMPNLIFWNVSSYGKDYPVTLHDSGTALVSGYSPTVMKAIASNKTTPIDIMMEAISYIKI